MSDFEFTFALFGLLLGLSIAEVLAGLARATEARLRPNSGVQIGWLTPMLGAFVLLDLLSFWYSAWVSRDSIEVSGRLLMAVTIFASSYYLAASLVFPRVISDGVDFDDHFFRVRKIVIGVMLALLICQLTWYAITPELAPALTRPLAIVLTLVLAALMIAAMFVQGKRWCKLAMGALIIRYVVVYLV